MVMTASAPVTASAGDEAAAAPWSINGAVLLLVRFQTVTSWPASRSRVAIGLPISPRPRKASLLIECSVLGVTCLELQSPYGARRGGDVDVLARDLFSTSSIAMYAVPVVTAGVDPRCW